MGYVKASSVPRSGGAMEFSGGLLPESAQADTYEDASKQVHVVIAGVKISAGKFWVKGAGLQLGMDFNTAELREPFFWRAVTAEFVGSLFFLFFTSASCVVCCAAGFARAHDSAARSHDRRVPHRLCRRRHQARQGERGRQGVHRPVRALLWQAVRAC